MTDKQTIIELEKCLLGSVISNNQIPNSWEKLKAEVFTEPKHRYIYTGITAIIEERRDINLQTVLSKLTELQLIEKSGGNGYIVELINAENVNGNEYLRKTCIDPILQDFQNRELKDKLEILSKTLKSGEFNYNKVQEELKKFFNEHSEFTQSTALSMSEMKSIYEEITTHDVTGINTQIDGLPDLERGEETIIGARPSIGKTSLMLRMMLNIAKNHKVGFLSLETVKEIIYMKLIAALTGIEVDRQRKHLLSDNDKDCIKDATEKLNHYNILLDSSCSHEINNVKAAIRYLVISKHCEVIFIDYLGCITTIGSEYEVTTKVSKELSALCKSLNIPFVIASQLSRNGEDKEPTLADLRQSGQIEQDADNVLLLHGERGNNERKIIIAKNRNGGLTGKVIDCSFNKITCSFTKIDAPTETPKPKQETKAAKKESGVTVKDNGSHKISFFN